MADTASLPEDQRVSARLGFAPGDVVSWIGEDADVPRGARGTVVSVGTTGDGRVRVQFDSLTQLMVFKPEELYCPDSIPKCFKVTFQPGKIGIAAEFQGSGLVQHVVPGSQGKILGVMEGMYFHMVDDQPFTEDLLLRHTAGDVSYTVTFGSEPPQLPQSQVAKLKPGQKVLLRGLQSKQDLNGKRGTLERFIEDKGRWQVVVDGSRKLFKAENLEPERAVRRGFLHRSMEREQQKIEEQSEDQVICMAAAALVTALAIGVAIFIQRKRPWTR